MTAAAVVRTFGFGVRSRIIVTYLNVLFDFFRFLPFASLENSDIVLLRRQG